MDESLIAALHSEERMILAELRGSLHFRRLEEIRHLLGLYVEHQAAQAGQDAPIGAVLDALLGDGASRRAPAAPSRHDVIALRAERAIA
ncbi:hypothetical protein [Roseomonas sp. CECT 9278]|uniref:hypothetical protein n=1 Tax=Roseomonas sp. CECT 9278 TaxID=2845823 RepID=UPI001E2CE9E9|nr:hypothetical protein [Roseomonas sp. CECT 9278]CAH0208079.1 hypothetical protein ROS9278_02097 [Roseomonas sp. CECT 9278]